MRLLYVHLQSPQSPHSSSGPACAFEDVILWWGDSNDFMIIGNFLGGAAEHADGTRVGAHKILPFPKSIYFLLQISTINVFIYTNNLLSFLLHPQ